MGEIMSSMMHTRRLELLALMLPSVPVDEAVDAEADADIDNTEVKDWLCCEQTGKRWWL